MSNEKRSFSRVPVRLKAYARVMQSIDSPQMFTGDNIGETNCRDDLLRGSKLPDDLVTFLAEMDRKMDRILGLLSKDHLHSVFPDEMEIMEISAAGVKFRTKSPVKTDTPMEIVIVLSQMPLKMAGSKGRIVGLEEESELYRFEFVDIRESDAESIIQFVFQQQREQIRNAKK